MKNFNWEEFKKGDIAVWCKTEELANDFLKECDKQNIRWGSGRRVTKYNCYDIYNENTCYNCWCIGLEYWCKKSYIDGGYEIIEWGAKDKDELELVESKQFQENYQCVGCLCQVVCKEKQNWAKAYDDHIRLRKESALFDEEPVCPCRLDKDKYKTKEEWEKEYIDKMAKDIKYIPLTNKKRQDYIWNPIVKDAEKKINNRLIKHEHNINDVKPIKIEFINEDELYNIEKELYNLITGR